MASTPILSLPTPDGSDAPDVPGDFSALAQAIEPMLVMPFADAAERDSLNDTPTPGMVCTLADTGEYQVYEDSEWRTFFTGKAPGSGISHGHISSYQTSPPSDARNGSVAVDRDTQQAYTKDNSGVWRPLASAIPLANISYRYGGAGFATAEGAVSNFCSMNVTTTAANTKVLIQGIGLYSLLGVGRFLLDYGGFQDVSIMVMATPPGGSLTELKRLTNRDMNTGGDGGTLVGGPTPRTASISHVYNATTVGTYTFTLRMLVGTAGNGNVANIGGEMTIQPVVQTTTF